MGETSIIPGGIKDITGNEALVRNIVQSIQIALRISRGAAIINVTGCGVSQTEIAQNVPPNFHHISVEDILKRQEEVSQDKKGLVLTGYSNEFTKSELNTVQSFIRSEAYNGGRNPVSGNFNIAVLTESMPPEDIFHDASMPWYNGPFQGDETIWSISNTDGKITLIQHKLQGSILTDDAKWGVQREIPMF